MIVEAHDISHPFFLSYCFSPVSFSCYITIPHPLCYSLHMIHLNFLLCHLPLYVCLTIAMRVTVDRLLHDH